MQHNWRLLVDDIHEARYHFAIEEAIARLVDEGDSPPTLRLRRVFPAVFVGVHQDTWSEVDVDYCKTHGIQIVRRMNGGGAVYHEMGSFCFSAFFKRETINVSDENLYQFFAEPIIQTCLDYGVNASFEGRNDVVVGDRKIYGCAHFTWYQIYIQSGTFLINMNFDTMERVLTPPSIKFFNKPSDSIKKRVTSLSNEVGHEIDIVEVMTRFANHTSKILRVQLIHGDLTAKEKVLSNELFQKKYSTDEWNLGSKTEFQVTVADRINDGVLSLSVEMLGNQILKARIAGDVLHFEDYNIQLVEETIVSHTIQEAYKKIKNIEVPVILKETLTRLIYKIEPEIKNVLISRTKVEKL